MEALHDIAIKGLELHQCPGGFDTLTHNPQAEVMAELDDRPDYGDITGVACHVRNKTLVDLQLVDGQAL